MASSSGSRSCNQLNSKTSYPSVRGPMDRVMENLIHDANLKSKLYEDITPAQHRNLVCMDIGRFLMENGIPLDCASSPSFIKMLQSIQFFGPGLKAPTTHEMNTWMTNEEVKNTCKTVEKIGGTWEHTGMSLLLDSWTDINNKSMVNFLMNNQNGTCFLRTVDASDRVTSAQKLFEMIDNVIEEIGEKIVIQVVTNNTKEYKLAGNMLMEKRKSLHWTPCVAHSIDLMLEKITELPQQKNVLLKAKRVCNFFHNHMSVLSLGRKFAKNEVIQPATTRITTAFLTLENMYKLKQQLQMMFVSNEWSDCDWSQKRKGKAIKNIIMDETVFWPSVNYFIKTTKPLVDVLRIVVGEKTPAIAFMYGIMHACKENIANNFEGDVSSYKEIWDIIDQNWESQLYRDLHVTAYYLNPRFKWSPNVTRVPEIKHGLYACMERLIKDEDTYLKVDLQFDKYNYKRGLFGCKSSLTSYLTLPPVEWWEKFGNEVPDLKLFATKILCLTCCATLCERKWNMSNQMHTKRRNRYHTEQMNSLLFIMYTNNLREKFLKNKSLKEGEDPLVVESVYPDDEWIANPSDDDEDDGDDDGEGESSSSKKRKSNQVDLVDEDDIDSEDDD